MNNIPSSFTDSFAYLTSLMTNYSGLFVALGIKLFDAFAVITVVWFGIQWALAGGMAMDRFASMLMKLAFGFAMMHFYSNFYHLILDEGTYLSNQLNQGTVANVYGQLTALAKGLEKPLLVSIQETIRYYLIFLAILFAQVAVFLVIAFGYVASGVLVLLGPIFVPFFIVSELDWLFWGWLKSFMQYAFYPVVANAYVYVFGAVLINFTVRTGTVLDSAKIETLFLPILFILAAFAVGVLSVPKLVNSMFTGRAGESAVPFV